MEYSKKANWHISNTQKSLVAYKKDIYDINCIF